MARQLLQQTGMSPKTADFVDNSIGIVGTMGGSAILSTSRKATYSLTTKTMGQITKNEISLTGDAINQEFLNGPACSSVKAIPCEIFLLQK